MGSKDEVDFPRGGAPIPHAATSFESRLKKASDSIFGMKRKHTDTEKEKQGETDKKKKVVRPKENDEYAGVWKTRISGEDYGEGVLCMGIVKMVKALEVILEVAGGKEVSLPANQINKTFTSKVKSGECTLDEFFHPGQMIALKVTKKSAKDKLKNRNQQAKVSCDPKVVNKHLVPARLTPGLVLVAAVESIEEKGALCDIGLAGLKGFLVGTNKVKEGQPIMVRIVSVDSRVVKLSCDVEGENLNVDAVSNLHMNNLMPGTILYADPEKTVSQGVFVGLGNGVRGFIYRRNLPPRLRADLSRLSKELRVVVLVCQQNSNLLVLSAHPDMIAVSKPERREQFEGIEVGDVVTCRVSFVDGQYVEFTLPDGEDGKQSQLNAASNATFLEHGDNLDDHYKIGSEHIARVRGVNSVERCLLISTLKETIQQKIYSFKDVSPGEIVTAVITVIGPAGYRVKINDRVNGFVRNEWATDKTITDLDKLFKVGQQVTCRVVCLDEERKHINLTSRQSLIKYNGQLITSYDESVVGKTSKGLIVTVLDHGGALVCFYNNVRGYLPQKELVKLRKSAASKSGATVECRVSSTNPADRKMSLELAEVNPAFASSIKVSPITYSVPGTHLYSGVCVDVIEKKIEGKKTEIVNLQMNLQKKKGSETTAVSSTRSLLTDCLDSPCESLKGTFKKGTKFDKLVPLGVAGETAKVVLKPFVSEWLSDPQNTVPAQIGELKPGQLVCGVIAQRIPDHGYLVELVGGSGILARAPLKGLDEGLNGERFLQVGQTVVAKVTAVNSQLRTVAISLKPSMCIPSDNGISLPLSLLRSAILEQSLLSSEHGLPSPGTTVSAVVTQIIDSAVLLSFGNENKLTGVSRSSVDSSVKIGSKVSAVVIDYTFPSCSAELVIIQSNTKKGKKGKEEDDKVGKVVLVKRDYIVVLSSSSSLHFIPSRLHPNIVTEKKGRYSLGQTIKLLQHDSIDGFSLSTSIDDENTLNQMSDEGGKMVLEDWRKIKPYKIFTGRVQGVWKGQSNEMGLMAVEVTLPGGMPARLHASELPERFMVEGTCPVEEYLKKYKGKDVNVKTIGSTKVTETTRQIEVTARQSKLEYTKNKKGRLFYVENYLHGSLVPVFALPIKKNAKYVKFEVSPLFSTVVPREKLPENVKSSVTEIASGQLFLAKIIGTDGDAHTVDITFAEPTVGSIGECVTGRVVSVTHSPLSVYFSLSDGHIARMGPTGVTGTYEKASQAIEQFEEDELYHIVIGAPSTLKHNINMDSEHKPKWDVVTKERWETKDDDEVSTKLISDMNEVVEGDILIGFVIASTPIGPIVEVGCGVVVLTKINTVEVNLDDLVNVTVVSIVDGKIWGCITGVIQSFVPSTPKVEARKRVQNSVSNEDSKRRKIEDTKKSKNGQPKKEEVEKKKTQKVHKISTVVEEDPGWDFSNEGFRPEDLVKVGKLAESEKIRVDRVREKEEEMKKEKEMKEKEKKKVLTKEEAIIEHEKELIAAESRLVEEEIPETDEEFAIMLKRQPNSAPLWIRYMTFFLGKEDLVGARETAERALKMINCREDGQRLSLWTAYLNMEVAFGTAETTKAVFERACGNVDSLKVHKQMAAILGKAKKLEEADAVYESMIKRFRALSDEVWTLYGEYLMNTDRAQKARETMKRALTSVPKQRHTQLISRFASLEFSLGDPERGVTLFESILSSFPKKIDVWTVYVDASIKHCSHEQTRKLFDTVCVLPLSMHKLRPFYKKWMEFEEKHGDEQSQNEVRERAEKYLQDTAKTLHI